jgi:hypothetical protein
VGKVHVDEVIIHQNCTCFGLSTSSYYASASAEENVSMSDENENGWTDVTVILT